ncbi:acyltransferase [soil metagenome]
MKKIENFYQNNFDAARLIAASLVLVTHCYELAGKLNAEPLYFFSSGTLRMSTVGLYVFFFTSGYLVSQSFFTTANTLQFIWKRFLRIYPALIVVVILTVFIAGPVFTTLHVKNYFFHADTAKYLLTISGFYIRYQLPGVFTNNFHFDKGVNGSLWSIALELQLYTTLIVAGFFYKKGFSKIFVLLLFVTLLFAFILWFNPFQLQAGISQLHTQLFMVFWVGSVSCIYYKKIPLNLFILFAVTALWVLSLSYLPILKIITEPLFFAYFTLYVCYRTAPLKLRADLSYGVYIYAFLLTQIFIELFPATNVFQLILFVISGVIPLSLLSWKLIESKALSLKKYPAFFISGRKT